MTPAAWLQVACADADKRGLPQLKPLLESLAKSTERLRAADTGTGAERQAEEAR